MKLKVFLVFLAILVIPSVLAAGNCTKESGRDYAKAGTLTVGADQYPDQCIDEVTLMEYFCDGQGLVEYEYYSCPGSCVDGACTGEVTTPGGNETTPGTGNETVPGTGPACTENWNCSDWSACVNSQQTRACIDNNKCGTTLNKPIEAQTCNPVPPATTSVGIAQYRYYILGGVVLLLVILYFVFKKKEPEVVAAPKTEEKK
jgi:hypothetical protein